MILQSRIQIIYVIATLILHWNVDKKYFQRRKWVEVERSTTPYNYQ